mmetsp:Transcript_18152/g.37804  ORF Transcript_18152/g.37804 Transcript_18152/m.37804 type:complete len:123 (+) Transcript_18152:1020-1388(+)
MWPTFNFNNIVVYERITISRDRIKTGDVIIAWSPTDSHKLVCKRVRGCEGERIQTRNLQGHVVECVVPRGHVWLEGDNPPNSNDSRSYGPVPAALVNAKVVYKIWPISEAGPVESKILDHSR